MTWIQNIDYPLAVAAWSFESARNSSMAYHSLQRTKNWRLVLRKSRIELPLWGLSLRQKDWQQLLGSSSKVSRTPSHHGWEEDWAILTWKSQCRQQTQTIEGRVIKFWKTTLSWAIWRRTSFTSKRKTRIRISPDHTIFPNQKIPLSLLLKGDKKKNPLMWDCEDDMIRCFHIPANNMTSCEVSLMLYFSSW